MKKITFYLDYPCYPIWIYDQEGDLIDNALPNEIENDKYLDDLLKEIQQEYINLFENNAKVFEYKGFSTKEEKKKFLEKIDKAVDILKEKLSDTYIIVKDVKDTDV